MADVSMVNEPRHSVELLITALPMVLRIDSLKLNLDGGLVLAPQLASAIATSAEPRTDRLQRHNDYEGIRSMQRTDRT